MRKLLYLLLFCIITNTAISQPKGDLLFTCIGEEDGLQSSLINGITQDTIGFIWLATGDGLIRYDGYSFKQYENDPSDSTSLSSNINRSVYADKNGTIWAVGRNGLSRYNSDTDNFTNYVSGFYIRTISQADAGSLWLGGDKGLFLFNTHTAEVIQYVHNEDDASSLSFNVVLSVLQDSHSRVWAGTDGGGLNLLDPQTGKFTHFTANPDDSTALSNDKVLSLFEDSDHQIWAGTVNGLCRYKEKENDFQRYYFGNAEKGNLIFDIETDTDGIIWLASYGGLIRFNPKTEQYKVYVHNEMDQYSLSDNRLRCLHVSPDGLLWAGSNNFICLHDFRTQQVARHVYNPNSINSISSNIVNEIIEDTHNNIWITTNNGIGLFDLETGSNIKLFMHNEADSESISNSNATCVYEDDEGFIWIGTSGGGVNKYNYETDSFEKFRHDDKNTNSLANDDVKKIKQDKFGNLWFGTLEGISVFDRNTKKFTNYRHNPDDTTSLSHYVIYEIFKDQSGNMWVGTQQGLNRFDYATGTFTWFNYSGGSGGTADNLIINIVQTDDGSLLVETGAGLCKLEDEKLIPVHMPKSLMINGIHIKDSVNIWLGGVNHFNTQTGKLTSFSEKDGLDGDIRYTDKKGRIFLGGNGLKIFHPDSIKENTNTPPVVLTDFMMFNKSVAISDTSVLKQNISISKVIELDYIDYIFAFEFAALNYRQPEKSQYKYMLEGYDRDWLETDYQHRRVSYTNVPHGSYTFKVIATNEDGYWNKEGASVKIIIHPPWWLTWWAKILYVVAVIAILIWFVRKQQLKIKRKEAELQQERIVSEKLRQADKLKDEFLANTSHELRTPINGIIGLADSLIDGAAGKLTERAIDDLTLVVSSGKRLAGLVNDILDFSKMRDNKLVVQSQPVDLFAVADVVMRLSQPLAKGKKLTLENHISKDLPFAQADENRLQQILYNLVGNALKFTHQGEIIVDCQLLMVDEGEQEETQVSNFQSPVSDKEFTINHSQLIITISDTGIGIPADKHEKIFESFEQADGSTAREYGGTGIGLAVTKQLVELLGGKIWLESEPGKGSVFYFTLPVCTENPEELRIKNAETTSIIKAINTENKEEDENDIQALLTPFAENTSRFKVLVVDDEQVNLRVLNNQLSNQNYSVVLAQDGFEALDILEKDKHIDIVVLDIMMPKMSGYEVCEKIRQKVSPHRLPVIMLTAKNRLVDLITGFNSGANDYLTKPFSKEELSVRVKIHLELLQANRELEDYSRTLEQKVEQRTTEIKEKNIALEQLNEEIHAQTEQLKEQNEKLIELDDFKQDMTSMIVHDLKNPLNAIINTPDKYNKDEKLKIKTQYGKQMLNLVMNILDVNKYENAKMSLNLQRISLYETAERAISQIQFLANQKQITIKNNILQNTAVKAEAEIIERIFVNILTNGIKYSEQNSEIIINYELGIRNEELNKSDQQFIIPNLQFVIIKITDSGAGISEDKRHLVFQKFGQVTAKKSGGIRSTGIGLTFCKMAIEAHGGEINFDSEEGVGTTFWFTLQTDNDFVIVKELKTGKKTQKDSLELSDKEKEYLRPFLKELSKYEIFRYTEIMAVLDNIKSETENIANWKHELIKIVDTLNEEKYIATVQM